MILIERLPRRLRKQHWTQVSGVPLPPAISASAWADGRGVLVISALVLAEAPDGRGDTIPQWHVSVSEKGARPSPEALRRALRAFRMEGTEEDNHHPGVARHFWLPVDPTRRVECQCKTDETIVQEPDAYTWTNPVEGPCRGCELASMLESLGITKPCPIHAQIDNGPVTHA